MKTAVCRKRSLIYFMLFVPLIFLWKSLVVIFVNFYLLFILLSVVTQLFYLLLSYSPWAFGCLTLPPDLTLTFKIVILIELHVHRAISCGGKSWCLSNDHVTWFCPVCLFLLYVCGHCCRKRERERGGDSRKIWVSDCSACPY